MTSRTRSRIRSPGGTFSNLTAKKCTRLVPLAVPIPKARLSPTVNVPGYTADNRVLDTPGSADTRGNTTFSDDERMVRASAKAVSTDTSEKLVMTTLVSMDDEFSDLDTAGSDGRGETSILRDDPLDEGYASDASPTTGAEHPNDKLKNTEEDLEFDVDENWESADDLDDLDNFKELPPNEEIKDFNCCYRTLTFIDRDTFEAERKAAEKAQRAKERQIKKLQRKEQQKKKLEEKKLRDALENDEWDGRPNPALRIENARWVMPPAHKAINRQVAVDFYEMAFPYYTPSEVEITSFCRFIVALNQDIHGTQAVSTAAIAPPADVVPAAGTADENHGEEENENENENENEDQNESEDHSSGAKTVWVMGMMGMIMLFQLGCFAWYRWSVPT